MSVDTTVSQRRALIDRLAESCLAEIGNISSNPLMSYSELKESLDGLVYTCLSTLPPLFTPLAKHTIAVRLFMAMLEEYYSDATGVALPHDFSRIMTARAGLTDCLRKVAMVLFLGKINVARAFRVKSEHELDDLATIEAEAIERARRGLAPVMYNTEQLKEIARGIDSLVSSALRNIDLIDAEIAIEEAVEKAFVALNDQDVRNFVEKVIGEDPVKCLNDHVKKYEEAKQSDSHVTLATSWVDRIYEDYQKCVEFSTDKPPCDAQKYLQDREICARIKCATRLITLVPGTLERLGVTTIVSQVVTK